MSHSSSLIQMKVLETCLKPKGFVSRALLAVFSSDKQIPSAATLNYHFNPNQLSSFNRSSSFRNHRGPGCCCCSLVLRFNTSLKGPRSPNAKPPSASRCDALGIPLPAQRPGRPERCPRRTCTPTERSPGKFNTLAFR